MDTIFIPLGRNCLIAGNLKLLNLRNLSLPFDWNLQKPAHKGLSCVNKLITNNFNGFTDNLTYHNFNNKPCSENYPNMIFVHHDLIKNSELINTFTERSKRFMKIIHSNKMCVFCYNISFSVYNNINSMKTFFYDITQFFNIMRGKCKFKLIIIVDNDIEFDLEIYNFIKFEKLNNLYFKKFIININVHKTYGDHLEFKKILISCL